MNIAIRTITNPIRRFVTTVSCFTCIPTSSASSADLSGLSKYLPALGLFIGVLLACTMWLLQSAHTDQLLSATLVTLSWLLLTRAVHFDGLMDAADGLLSHRNRDRMLEIMRDSRVGNFGAIVGMCTLLLKVVSLNSLPLSAIPTVLILVPAWARFSEVYAIGAFPYLRAQGMGKVWHDTTRFPHDLLISGIVPTIACVLGIYFCVFHHVPAVSLFTVTAGVLAAILIARVLGGHTGDTYGATTELAETVGLLSTALYYGIKSGA